MGRQNGQPFPLCWVQRIANIDSFIVTDQLVGTLVVFFNKLRHTSAQPTFFVLLFIALRHRYPSVLSKRGNVFGIQLCYQIRSLRLSADKIPFQRFAVTLTSVCHNTVDFFGETDSVTRLFQCIITKEAKRGHNRKERPIAVLFCFTLYLYWEKGIISRVNRPVGSIEPS